jgi:hypothetical protein
MKLLMGLLAGVMLALLPAAASAQTPSGDDGVILRVRGDVTIPRGETVATVIVIDGNLTIEGTVRDLALVIEGNADVRGNVQGDLTVISGDIQLGSAAVVKNVNSIRGDFERAQGATVTGDVNERDNFGAFWAAAGIFSALLWLALTIVVIVADVLFALIGGRQLNTATDVMTGEPVNAILGAVFFWVGVPLLAILAMITVIGIPLGLGMLLFLLPAFGFLGYIVAATRLGVALVSRGGREAGDRPVLAAALGALLLQLLLLVPFLGALVAFIAALWGTGALAYVAFRGAGGRGFEGRAPAPTEA